MNNEMLLRKQLEATSAKIEAAFAEVARLTKERERKMLADETNETGETGETGESASERIMDAEARLSKCGDLLIEATALLLNDNAVAEYPGWENDPRIVPGSEDKEELVDSQSTPEIYARAIGLVHELRACVFELWRRA